MLANNFTIYSILKRNVRVLPNRISLMSGKKRITHRQFLEKVDQLAYGLSSEGLTKGDRIGVLAHNSLQFVYLYGAAAKIGAIMLPINWRLSSGEIEYIISDASPKVLFVGPEYQSTIAPLISRFCFIEKYYSMGRSSEHFMDFNDLIEPDGVCPEVDVCLDDPYVLFYTAAVQGRPRGATLTHQNIIISNLQLMYIWNLREEDVQIVILPLFHYAALHLALSVMQVGGTNIILSKFDVDLMLQHIQEDKVTIFGEFPPILATLLDKAKDADYDFSSLRNVVGLDQVDTVKKFEEMTGGVFWAVYGQSETSGFVSVAPYFERPGSAGLPNFLSEVEIVDNYGNLMATGKSGEIVVRGPSVFKGYWNLKKENEYTFRDGWHHTGDMGYFDADGYLWYSGRKQEKELIKPGGENVYPSEVEKVILVHPLVEEAVVIGVDDSQWGEAIKAVCVLKKNEILTETELIEFVAARIARFKKPKYVCFVSNLPRTKENFIDRERIKTDYGAV